jgi:hypothetical protein
MTDEDGLPMNISGTGVFTVSLLLRNELRFEFEIYIAVFKLKEI